MKSHLSSVPIRLLHIDDCPDDRTLVAVAIRRSNTPFELYSADGPQSAESYFQPCPETNDSNPHPRPALVLLDYAMGSQTGIDFLLWLRLQMKITSIPVVMYAGFRGVSHLSDCYAAGANHFLSKPAELTGAQTIMRTLHVCMSSSPPRFEPLTHLPEYHRDPRKYSNQHSAVR